MSVHDLDRQDRLEGLAKGHRLADELAQLDSESLFQPQYIDLILGSRAFYSGGIDLGIIMAAAEKHRNETLHTIARVAAAAAMKDLRSHDSRRPYMRLVERSFPNSTE